MIAPVISYWRQRLDVGKVFYRETNYELPHSVINATTAIPTPAWPTAVNTVVFYNDFLFWYHDTYIKPLSEDYPYAKPPHVRFFFAALKPFIVLGTGRNPRMRKVLVPRVYEGTVFYEKRYQRFIHLSTLQEHLDIYRKLTKEAIG